MQASAAGAHECPVPCPGMTPTFAAALIWSGLVERGLDR
jgi:hypothetical protein